jgi:hypothetical protein
VHQEGNGEPMSAFKAATPPLAEEEDDDEASERK